MISADVKDDKNIQKEKIWLLYLSSFYRKYLQNLKYNINVFIFLIGFG